jgi:hypothetical protein
MPSTVRQGSQTRENSKPTFKEYSATSDMRHDLIIIDELGYLPFSQSGAQLLFHLISKLYENTSTIVTTNLALADWPQVFGYAKACSREGGDDHCDAGSPDRSLRHRRSFDGLRVRPATRVGASRTAPEPTHDHNAYWSHIRPGCETPAISAGANALVRALQKGDEFGSENGATIESDLTGG